jgi:DNA-binding transcriptional regulator YiaG
MTIKEARESVHMTRNELCDWLEIPYRTLQNWELGTRLCPPYIERLIVEKIIKEKG